MNSYQTPDEQHLQNWMKVVQLAYWLLWVAEPEARVLKGHTPKWQRYLKKEKQRSKLDEKLYPSQVQRVLSTIFFRL